MMASKNYWLMYSETVATLVFAQNIVFVFIEVHKTDIEHTH